MGPNAPEPGEILHESLILRITPITEVLAKPNSRQFQISQFLNFNFLICFHSHPTGNGKKVLA
jgi:hypothetical protein